jgi:hypothetical protein
MATIVGIALLLFWHAQPLADDFYRIDQLRKLGYFGTIHAEYLGYNGRWFAEAIQDISAAKFVLETRYYPFFLVAIASVLVVACYRLAGAVVDGALRAVRVAMAAGLLCLFWTRMPGPGEIFYWLPGAVEDQLSISLYILILAALLRAANAGRVPSLGENVLLAAAVFAACGIHELYAILFGVVATTGLFIAYAARAVTRRTWLLVAAASVAGFAVVYVAPGNRVRAAEFRNHGNIPVALKLAAVQAKYYLLGWSQNFALWIGTLLFLAHPAIQASQPRWTRNWLPRWWFVPLLAWVMLLCGGFLGPSWAMGWEMADRTAGALFFCFLIGWMLNAFLLTRDGAPLGPGKFNWPRLRPWLLVGFSLALLTGPNVPAGFTDVLHRSGQFAAALHERENLLEQARQNGQADVSVPPIDIWPASYPGPLIGELNKAPDYWVNQSVAECFGLRSVRLQAGGCESQKSKMLARE